MQAKMSWLWSESPWVYTQGMCTASPGGGGFFMWSTTVSHSSHLSLMSSKGISLEIKSCRPPPVSQSCGYWGVFKGVESILAGKTAGVVVCTVDDLLMLQWKCANTQGWNFGELLWGLRAIPYLRNSPAARKLKYSLSGRILSYYFPSQTSAVLSHDVLCTSPNFSAPPGACKSWNKIQIAASWQG